MIGSNTRTVGAGQAGLTSAARLQHMGLRVLVIEKTPRVGDVWRNRWVLFCPGILFLTSFIAIGISRCTARLISIRVSSFSLHPKLLLLTSLNKVLYEPIQ